MSESDAFSPDEFDPWAESYDRDTVTQRQFPFAGYDEVLSTIVEQAAPEPGMTVLDIGTGTGNLAVRFAKLGCELWCTDFSEAMLAKAREKLPQASFILHDLRQAWPVGLNRRFDRIVSAYVFHHFDMGEKVKLCKAFMAERLAEGGKLVIGDLSFANQITMQIFARSIGELWEQEHYWLADECLAGLSTAGLSASYTQVSPCAGVYLVQAGGPRR